MCWPTALPLLKTYIAFSGCLALPVTFFFQKCLFFTEIHEAFRYSSEAPGHDSVKLCGFEIVTWLATLASPICKMRKVRQAWKGPKSSAERYCLGEIGLRGAVDLRLFPLDIVIPGSLKRQLLCSFRGSQRRIISTGAHQWTQKRCLWLNFPSGDSAPHALTVLRLPVHLAKWLF